MWLFSLGILLSCFVLFVSFVACPLVVCWNILQLLKGWSPKDENSVSIYSASFLSKTLFPLWKIDILTNASVFHWLSLYRHSSKYFCFSYKFGKTWGWINDSFHFLVNYSFKIFDRCTTLISHLGIACSSIPDQRYITVQIFGDFFSKYFFTARTH